jgi:predicted transcriptional regulator
MAAKIQPISEYIGSEAKASILDYAFDHPALRITPRTRNTPTLDTAIKAVVSAIEDAVIMHFANLLKPELQDAYDNYLLFNGEHDDADDQNEWESGMDDVVEKIIEPHERLLSADWLGRNMVNVDLHVEDGIHKLSMKFGQECYNTLTQDLEEGTRKSPAKVMSSAGITSLEVEARLQEHIAINKTKPKEETETMATDTPLNAVLSKIAEHVGKDFDELLIYDDFDQVSDDDELLAQGAAQRLGGLDADEIAELAALRMEHGDDTATQLIEMLREQFTSKKKPGKKTVSEKLDAAEAALGVNKKTPAAKPSKPEPDDAAAEAEASDVISIVVFEALKECGAQDAAMGQLLGVSRPTYNNYVNGKSECKLDDSKRMLLRQEVVDRINKLHVALAELDGTEAEEII